MDSIIVELGYFPDINFFSAALRHTCLHVDPLSTHVKKSQLNRCWVLGAEGKVRLSIPILGGRDQKMPMKDVRIDHKTNWPLQHWRTLTAAYNRSPWFEHYKDGLAVLYQQKKVFLLDWNERCWNWIMPYINKSVVLERISNDRVGDEHVLKIDKAKMIQYHQVFQDRIGFHENMSILDLLFCVGPQARVLLTQ